MSPDFTPAQQASRLKVTKITAAIYRALTAVTSGPAEYGVPVARAEILAALAAVSGDIARDLIADGLAAVEPPSEPEHCVCCTHDCGDRRGHIREIERRDNGTCVCGQLWPCRKITKTVGGVEHRAALDCPDGVPIGYCTCGRPWLCPELT